jgi:O-antigen ligase
MKFLRFAICFLIAFSVLAHGAVEDWARAVYESAAGILFLIWSIRTYFRQNEEIVLSPLLPPLTGLFLIAAVQLIFPLTIYRFSTRFELLLLLADLLVLFIAVQAYQTLVDWRGFVWFGMSFGFLVSLFGILQHLTFNGKLYWFREMRYGGIPFGPYANRNHFAGFAELIIPLALVPLILGRVRRERWPVVGLFAIVPIGALLLSASRGGIVSLAVELFLLMLVIILRKSVGKHIFGAGAILFAALLLVSWLGATEILQRFSTLQTLEATASKRASMRSDTWKIFLDHPVIGTGLGTIQVAYPPYETLYDGKIVNHSHNDYLEAFAETGLLGGLCCAWFLAVLLIEGWKRSQNLDKSFATALQLAGWIGCCGLLVHSFVDFNLHIPANALLFFLMSHLATADIQQTSAPAKVPRRRGQSDDSKSLMDSAQLTV